MTRASSLSPSTSIFSSMIDNKEDNAKRGCEGLVKELELPLPETNAMVGAEGFSILALVLTTMRPFCIFSNTINIVYLCAKIIQSCPSN